MLSLAQDKALELEWRIWSVATLRSPGRLGAIGEAVDSDADFRPTKASRTFPPGRRLKGTFTQYATALEAKFDPAEVEGWFYERELTPRGSGEMYFVDNGRLRHNRTHDSLGAFTDTDWFASPDRLERLSAYLTRIADTMQAFHGYCALNLMTTQRIRFLKKNASTWIGRLGGVGRVMEDQQREVSDIYWWNYFGPAFVERWGGRLESLGVKQTKTPAGAIVIWATDSPFVYDPKVKKLGAYEWKHPFYEALGKDVFMREGQTQREPGEVVPSWDDQHRAAGVDVSSLEGPEPPAIKGGGLLPRVVVLNESAQAEEPDA